MATNHDAVAGRVAGATQGPNSTDRLVDEYEASARLGLSVKTLRRWRWARKGLAYVKVGTTSVRYSERDLAAFVAAGRHAVSESRQ